MFISAGFYISISNSNNGVVAVVVVVIVVLDFAVPAAHRVNIKENDKRQVLKPSQRTKKKQ